MKNKKMIFLYSFIQAISFFLLLTPLISIDLILINKLLIYIIITLNYNNNLFFSIRTIISFIFISLIYCHSFIYILIIFFMIFKITNLKKLVASYSSINQIESIK